MTWLQPSKPLAPLCANVREDRTCTRRATHTAKAGNLIALVCAICAGEAHKADPRVQFRELHTYRTGPF